MFKNTTDGKRINALYFLMPKATKSHLRQSNLIDKKVCSLAHLKQSNLKQSKLNVARKSYQWAYVLIIISICQKQCVQAHRRHKYKNVTSHLSNHT